MFKTTYVLSLLYVLKKQNTKNTQTRTHTNTLLNEYLYECNDLVNCSFTDCVSVCFHLFKLSMCFLYIFISIVRSVILLCRKRRRNEVEDSSSFFSSKVEFIVLWSCYCTIAWSQQVFFIECWVYSAVMMLLYDSTITAGVIKLKY